MKRINCDLCKREIGVQVAEKALVIIEPEFGSVSQRPALEDLLTIISE